MKSANYTFIDIFKFIAAILVVAIHTSPLEDISSVGNFYFVHVLCRIAVPIFFAASGFFFFNKLIVENGKIKKCKENSVALCNYVKRLVLLYVIWSAIYLLWQIPYNNSIGWTGFEAVKDYVVSFFLNSSFYHFWYFLCLIYGVVALYFVLRVFNVKVVLVLAACCYAVKCWLYGYWWLLPVPSVVSQAYSCLFGVFDAFLLAIPFMLVGALAGKKFCGWRVNKKTNIIGLIISAVCLITEASCLYFFSPNNSSFSYIIFTLPVCFFLFNTIEQSNISCRKVDTAVRFRKMSTLIYCIHPMIINLLGLIKGYDSVNSVIHFILVASISIAFSLLLILLQRNRYFSWMKFMY